MPRPLDTAIVSDGPPPRPLVHTMGESLAGIVCERCGVVWSTSIAAAHCVDPHADTAPIDVRIDSDDGPTVVRRNG